MFIFAYVVMPVGFPKLNMLLGDWEASLAANALDSRQEGASSGIPGFWDILEEFPGNPGSKQHLSRPIFYQLNSGRGGDMRVCPGMRAFQDAP